MKKNKVKIVLEVRDGAIQFIGSTTDEVEITLIDHDWEDGPGKQIISIDKVMTEKQIENYIKKA